MAQLIIFLGLLLCGQTVAILFLSTTKYPSEFIPMIFGIPVLFAGVVALNPHRRYRTSWLLGGLAVVGLLISGIRALVLTARVFGDQPPNRFVLSMVWMMTLICVSLLVACWLMWRKCRRSARRTALVPAESKRGIVEESDDPVTQPAASETAITDAVGVESPAVAERESSYAKTTD